MLPSRLMAGVRKLGARVLGAPTPTATSVPPASSLGETSEEQGHIASLAVLASRGELGQARHVDTSDDLEGYRARMALHGKEIELAGEGLNKAEDGGVYLGPVDNESSRACAEGQVLTIDQDECISCGTCVENADGVFHLGEDDKSGDEVKAEVLKQRGAMDLIQDAIDACPVTCIEWIEEDEVAEQHSHGGFEG